MTREQVKEWLLNNTESIEQTDIENQTMLGEDVIDLMVDLVKNNDSLHSVSELFNEALRDRFFKECTGDVYDDPTTELIYKRVELAPHDLFEWFKKNAR